MQDGNKNMHPVQKSDFCGKGFPIGKIGVR